MALSKKPVNGMKDILPEEMQIRDYVQQVIKETYRSFGFTPIETPCMENIANLSNKQGGENLKLIFKVMKRGEKLKIAEAKEEAELVDFGMRYDLTVPLVRFYANNANDLPSPFKALQMGSVWRADRPQRGRYRQFMQCDIDIIGSDSTDSEVELILTTTKALKAIGMKNFKVKVNDRRLLRAFLMDCGFEEEQLDSVCITFDKMDKIGLDGVKKELADEAIGRFTDFLSGVDDPQQITLESVKSILVDKAPAESLEYIINTVNALCNGEFDVVFDLSLVRGQGYYTGTVFEVESIDFKGAIAGGGRYDNLIGKFLGQQVSAVGFSIGFERIFSILMEHGVDLADKGNRIAVMYDEGDLTNAYRIAEKYRAEGKICSLYVKPKKMGKFLSKLQERGYAGFINVSNGDEISDFE